MDEILKYFINKAYNKNSIFLSESGNRMIQKDGVNIEMLPDDWKRTWHVI